MTTPTAGPVALHVETDGSGESVVLLHGIGGRARSCSDLAARLTPHGYATHRVDAAGYGRSPDPESVHVDPVATVLGVIERVSPDAPVHVIGTSWGGVIALELAARHPDRVRTLVVADSTRGSGLEPARAEAMRARVDELDAIGPTAFAASRAPRLAAPGASPDLLARITEDMAHVRIAGYAAAAHYMARTDLSDVLDRIHVPTLVVVGEHDHITGVEESRLLATMLPDARFVLVPDAGHAAIQEQPADVSHAILRFWAEVDR